MGIEVEEKKSFEKTRGEMSDERKAHRRISETRFSGKGDGDAGSKGRKGMGCTLQGSLGRAGQCCFASVLLPKDELSICQLYPTSC